MSKQLHMAAYVLLWIGGINWGMIGIFNTNVVAMVFGDWPWLINATYTLVGISAAYLIANHKSYCDVCLEEKPTKKSRK